MTHAQAPISQQENIHFMPPVFLVTAYQFLVSLPACRPTKPICECKTCCTRTYWRPQSTFHACFFFAAVILKLFSKITALKLSVTFLEDLGRASLMASRMHQRDYIGWRRVQTLLY